MKFSNPWKKAEPSTIYFSNHWKLFLLAGLLGGVVAAQEPGQEISGFRVPEYDENGEMTSQLFGDHAEFESAGVVKITTLRVEFYKEDKMFMEVGSPWCFYNQEEQKAHSDAPLRADMDNMQLTGMGFKMDSASRTVHVLRDSKVVVTDMEGQSGLPGGGERGSNDVTVITSKELFLNYHDKSARFVNNVHVEDPELKLDSESLEMRFGDDNQIEWIEALTDVHVESPELNLDSGSLEIKFDENGEIGWIEALTDVRILHEGREAYAGKLVYEGKTGEYVLEDEPKLVQGKSWLTGERIRFWRDRGKMICEPSARLVFYADEDNKMDIFGN